MTNKEDVDEAGSDIEPRLAAFLAMHLVSQVLDEAYIIANAAKDSGQPWRYLSILKNLRSGKLGDPDEENTFTAPPPTCNVNVEYEVNNLATSTPQKLPDNVLKTMEESMIGQGDEDFDSPQSNLSKATSMFINHLFDMSEVEHIYEYSNKNKIDQSKTYDVKNVSMHRIVESCVDAAFDMATGTSSTDAIEICKLNLFRDSNSSDLKAVMSLDDAFNTGADNINSCNETNQKTSGESNLDESGEPGLKETPQRKYNSSEKQDFTIYERAYSALNRDDEPCAEDCTETILVDPNNLFMQDVELLKVTDKDEDCTSKTPTDNEEIFKIPEIPPTEDPKRSTLAQRCRVQGIRLLARLRGWWRRKVPGRRMEYRVQRAARDLYPKSPDPRRRVASLRGNRHIFSPSPSSSVLWKFNTVNEGLVNRSHWKEFKYELKGNGDENVE